MGENTYRNSTTTSQPAKNDMKEQENERCVDWGLQSVD
jgi:hypothetical protein